MEKGYYMFKCNTVNASTQSVVAMSSYRSGEKLYCEKDGLTRNYKERFVKPETFIMKPSHAPDWTLEREKLWNEVERFENRDNARLARNVVMSLPNDMTNEQQLELTKEFVKENFVDEGMVADVAIHRDDVNNPHAHVLLTVREFDKNGEWEKRKSKRIPKLDENGNQMYNEKGWRKTVSVKLNDWDKDETLIKWRENWADKLNEKSLKYGLNKVYSHKSFEEQGRLKKAQLRLTRNEYQFEQKRKKEAEKNGTEYKPKTYYAKKNEEIKEYNKQFDNVIHLEDYKTNKNYKSIFDNIRSNQPYNEERIEATKKMVDRAKGYVNYSIAKDLYNDFHDETSKWKLKLKRDATTLNSKKEFYNHLIEEYAKNKESVVKYGYSIDNFKQEIAKDLEHDVKEKHADLESEINKFNELKDAAHVSYSFQKDILQNEFYAIYGDSEHFFTDDEKNFAVQLMKDYQICLPEDKIKEEYLKSIEQGSEHKYVPAWKQAKDTIVSLNIYERTLNKLENINTDNLTAEDRKDTEIKYRTFTNLKSMYTDILSHLEPLIDEELKMTFNDIPNDEVLYNTSVEVKSALLEKHHNLTDEQQKDISFNQLMTMTLKEKESQYDHVAQKINDLDDKDRHKDAYNDVAKQYNRIIDGIIAMFEEMSRNKQNDRFIKGRDSTKTFRRKGADGKEI